jgi:hypothetical protein
MEGETMFKLVQAGRACCTEGLDHLPNPVAIDHMVFITASTGNLSKTE